MRHTYASQKIGPRLGMVTQSQAVYCILAGREDDFLLSSSLGQGPKRLEVWFWKSIALTSESHGENAGARVLQWNLCRGITSVFLIAGVFISTATFACPVESTAAPLCSKADHFVFPSFRIENTDFKYLYINHVLKPLKHRIISFSHLSPGNFWAVYCLQDILGVIGGRHRRAAIGFDGFGLWCFRAMWTAWPGLAGLIQEGAAISLEQLSFAKKHIKIIKSLCLLVSLRFGRVSRGLTRGPLRSS